MPMNLNFADPKIKIFRDFRVSVLSPIPISENSDITEIYQKPQKTEIWECNFKNPWIIVQMTSFSKWSSHLANHVPYVSRDSDNCRFFKSSLFFHLFVLFISVLTRKKLKKWSKTDPHSFELYKPQNKDFRWFPGFRVEPYTQKRKPITHGNSTKMP